MDRSGPDLYDSNMTEVPLTPLPDLPPDRAILSFNLFGESADLPDVVHCETLAARSVLHGWELAPHRHARLHQLLLVRSGGGMAQLDGRAERLGPMSLVNVPIGHVHAFSFVPGTQGWVLTLAAEMFDEALSHAADLRRTLAQPGVVRADTKLLAQMKQIGAEFEGRRHARAQVLRGLSATLLGLVARRLVGLAPREGGATGPRAPAESILLGRLEALIESHYLEHWGVADYARTLAVTPTHLSRVARQATGRPASKLIEERLIREARRNLVYTHLQVATIAYALGFADAAHFSRVFAKATGLSPRRFRDRLGGRSAA